MPISANSAFNAVTKQKDPLTGYHTTVALVDVRSRAEYFWVGTATKVVSIIMEDGATVKPDLGKVILSRNGKALLYKVHGHDKWVPVKRVYKLEHEPIAISIPFMLWDEDNPTLDGLKNNLNPEFEDGIEDLHDEKGVEVVILFCRSGGRSTGCVTRFSDVFDKFSAVYEIDDPAGNVNFGGFEGSSYNDVYNGYRGFPGRKTHFQDTPSVSWKDAGLPMKTSIEPALPDHDDHDDHDD